MLLSSLVFLKATTKRKGKQSNKNECLMQVKIARKCHFTPTGKAIIRKTVSVAEI